MVKYTKAQRAAYAKRKRGKKTTVKRVVKRIRAQRVESKDRIANVRNFVLTSNAGSATLGPENSIVLVPESLFSAFSQGSLNGQIDGNSMTPKYLNLKMALNFDKLPAYSSAGVMQQYNVRCYQLWVQRTLKDAGHLAATHLNTESNRTQPAFLTGVTGSDLITMAQDEAKQVCFNARLQPDFLTYDKKSNDNLQIIKQWRVLGDTTKRFQSAILANSDATVSPDKHYSFNWRMPQTKRELNPIKDVPTDMGVASMWIPAILITMETKNALGQGQGLNISTIDHFTYTDA